MKNYITTTVRVPKRMAFRIKLLSKLTRIPQAVLIRDAIDLVLERHRKILRREYE